MSRNFKKIAVASALVAATTLPTTMVSALETNVKNDSNTPVTLSSERRGWYEEYGYKYYYDDNGELLKGLQEIDGNTYYFYSYDGHMAYSSWSDEDTITDNGLIVTVNKSGIVTNYANIVAGDWTHYGDKWYYYDADMNPYIGVKTINGVKYYFEWEGRLATRTYEGIWVITFDRQLIAYNQNGVVTDQQDIVGNKWIKVNNKWYYFDKNLNPYQGVQKVDGVEYFFWSDGQLVTYDYDGISTATSNNYLVSYNKNGVVIEKVKIEGNKWIKFNNNWYYYDQDLYPYQGIHTIGDATYYFWSNGQLATSGSEGNITTVREGNKYYAYDYTGKVVEQVEIVGNKWIEFNGGKYYFDSELTPYSGIQTIDGVEYYFNYGQLAEYLDEVVTSGDTLAYVRDGKVIEIPSKEVTIGDEVYLEAGDFIPADGRILENASMKVDESALTGESVAVEKSSDLITGEVALGDRTNMVYSGSFVTYGRGNFLVTGIGMETEVGKIAQLLKSTSEKKTPLQVNLDNFGKKLSIIIMVFCALLFGIISFKVVMLEMPLCLLSH